MKFTSKQDTYYIQKTAKAVTSADGLKNFVDAGKNVSDYAWVQYTFRYNTKELNSRGLQSRYVIDTLPKGCVIAKSSNVIKNEDGTVSYKVEETSVPENSGREYSIIVGYPESYAGKKVKNTVDLIGTYLDEKEETKLATSEVEVELKKISENIYYIITPGKNMSPDYVYKENLSKDINFSASLSTTTTVAPINQSEYTVALTDDLLEIYTDKYYRLQDNEYEFTKVTVPCKNNFYNSNGYVLSDGNYTVKIKALYKNNVNTRGISEYTTVYEGKWEDKEISKDLENAVAVRVEVSGLTESIKGFYINVKGKINISNSEYENPTYIKNYDFTDLIDKDGKSLITDVTEENYAETRIYELDKQIYGKGQLRSSDVIRIIERPEKPEEPEKPERLSYYYSDTQMSPFEVDKQIENFVTKQTHTVRVNNTDKKEINKVQIYGVNAKVELKTLIETLKFTYSGLKFKNELSEDVNMQDYLRERASIEKNEKEICVTFNFADNPIVSTDFNIGYNVESNLSYEDYYDTTDPTYKVFTYGFIEGSKFVPQLTSSYKGKTMASSSDTENILLALASHQQLIKEIRTEYTKGEFVESGAVVPLNTEYTYRLKLRNGYNTLVNTEFIDVLEHAELTKVDEEYPYSKSEWYGKLKNVDTTYIESKGLTAKVYYANTTSPQENDWILMESYTNGIWQTESEAKAIKVKIEGEIQENSIVNIDVNMVAPNDESLEDKYAYNTYTINSEAIDLYTGLKAAYLKDMPSNVTEVRLTKKEYNVEILKVDEVTKNKLSGVQFGIYDEQGKKLKTCLTGLLGIATIKNLKEGTYTIKEEIVPLGYDKAEDYTLIIENGNYTLKQAEEIKAQGEIELEGNIPTIKITIENKRAKGSITVYKIDEYLDTNKQEIPLQGVEFNLLDTDQNVIATGTTNESGNIVFEGLEWGKTYILKEKQALQGYELAEKNTYLSKLNKDKVVIVENVRKTGTVTLTKEDEKTTEKIQGAKYGLYAKEDIYNKKGEVEYQKDQLISEKTTNENGQVTFEKLTWGEYYIKETKTVYGYELSEEKLLFTVNDQNVENVIQKTAKEVRSKANLELLKVDDKGKFLQGVEFELFDENGNKKVRQEIDSGESQLTFKSTGTYAWKQNEDGTWQSENYHVNNSTATMESDEFTIQNGTLTFDWSVSSESVNYDYAYYTITNVKTGETIGDANTKIGGTSYGTGYNSLKFNSVEQKLNAGTYKISFTYIKDSSGHTGLDRAYVKNAKIAYEKIVEIPYLTDENGSLKIENIEWGNYYIKEKEPLSGYKKIDTKFEFTVNRETFLNGNKVIASVQNSDTKEQVSIIKNERKQGKVILTKYSCNASGEETENTLEGAKFELYKSDGELVGEYTTDENGQIVIENLDWDSYYFQEKEAPEGYSISDKKIAFVVNSKNVEFTQELKAYNKLKAGEITINKTIKANSLEAVHGNVTFMFKIVGKDESGEEKVTLYKTVTFSDKEKQNADLNGDLIKSIVISDVEAYKYEITEEDNYRYSLDEIIPITNASKEGNKAIINLTGVENIGEVTFKNTKDNNSLLTHAQLITNSPQSSYYLIGISAKAKEESYVVGTKLTGSDFTYTLYYSNGDEQTAELTEGITFNGESSYKEDLVGSYITKLEYTLNGKVFETEVTTKWIMPSDYFIYDVIDANEKTIAIKGINSKYESPSVLYIPSEYNGYNVKEIKEYMRSMYNINNVKSVVIEEGIMSIGSNAFSGCSKLTSIEIPSSVTSIGDSAFKGCSSLTNIEIPSSVTSIGDGAFRGCSKLTSIEIPSSVTSIGYGAFSGCSSLTSIEIPSSVTSIGDSAFSGCSKLTSIEIPSSVTSIGYRAFEGCSKLTSIEIPSSVTSIGDYVFFRCSGLTNIEIPSSVTSIGDSAFRECSKLTSIEIPSSVTSIGSSAFYRCSSLTSIEIPSSVTSIGDGTFSGCSSLTSIEIPSSVTSIGNSAFYGCSSLTSINIPEGVTSIGSSAFSGCKRLTSIEIPEGVTSIGSSAFFLCRSLTSIEIPSSVTSIGNQAFDGCSSLTNIEIPEGVTSIGNYAFQDCRSLTSIEIPSSVTSIGDSAFRGCDSLTSINVEEDNQNYCGEDGVLFNKDKTELIRYPSKKADKQYVIPNSVTSIGNYAFEYCSSLTSINIPEGITSIGDSAFRGCSSLTNIEIPSSVTSIGDSVFRECSSLTSIEIPSSVTSIGSGAFYDCSNLTTINYHGTPEQFSAITIGSYNDYFKNATVNYIE
ncbi:MAG TPA: leucine-rich repeat protein [Clostridiaceae bacterium]|nr:leucine-rich repeat protein [Clostridiaceae bacterium]